MVCFGGVKAAIALVGCRPNQTDQDLVEEAVSGMVTLWHECDPTPTKLQETL